MLRQTSDLSASALTAGLLATVISYAGPLVIVFQAATSAGLSPALLSSWVWAISLGSAVLGIGLSLWWRVPIVVAWSAPGSALLVLVLPEITWAEAIGAYLVANVIVLVVGLSGTFERLTRQLPTGVAAAMLAGILFSFGTSLFVALGQTPLSVGAMLITYLLGRRYWPRHAVLSVLVVAVAFALGSGQPALPPITHALTLPVWTTPVFRLDTALNLGLPLALVALTGQFVPGMAVLQAAGYAVPPRPLLTSCSLVSLVLAPFGCHGLNLAAITAALCTGPDAHPDPARRYVAGVAGGVTYLLLGLFGASLVALFTVLPPTLVAALAGLALFGAIAGALSTAMSQPDQREPALATFLVTASGMSLLGLSAAFWGLLIGMAAHHVLNHRRI